jgi:Protein of unknown function (DUF723).
MSEQTDSQSNRSIELCKRVVTTESFIAEAKEIYGDRYDYSKVDYKNKEHRVTIVCPVHGDFQVYAREHLDGKGCPKCEKGEKFLLKLKEKFGDKFGLDEFVYESSTAPVTLVCPTHGAFSRLPHQILNSSLGCPECANDIVRQKQETAQIAAKKAMEGKRLTATKGAIETFRKEHPSFTDEYLASCVESTYPQLYEDNLEVALEIVRELYRRQEEWTDESFISLLKEMTEGRKLVRFGIEERKQAKVWAKVNPFIERLYHEAQERTIYLSECPEYQDEDVKQYFENVYSDKDKTLAQKFFTLLNNRALYDTDQISGFVLPFHCYSEPNGDVVFTKNKRSRGDYNEKGIPMRSESDISKRNEQSLRKTSGANKGGCLGMALLIIVFILISIYNF